MPNVQVSINQRNIEVNTHRTNVTAGIIRSEVSSVAGKTGAVLLDIDDIDSLQEALDSISAGSDKTFVHNQTLASTNWLINHGLNKFPSVTIVDSGGNQVIGEIIFDPLNLNSLMVSFSNAFSGQAYLN
jgi:hypothetical protein